jgi:tRNA A-37 threonylcarbamoyl transferase component Bud32
MIQRLGKYQIEAQIGRGGMGAVYRAHDPLLKRQVALKVISENVDMSDELRARFFREAQACAQLSHPNIITVYDLGEDDGRLFLVMEYLEGEELKEIITQRRELPLEHKLALMMQICDGLGYAHEKGIVHRDVKPGNVFVLQNGTAKVLDFGVARLASASDDLTRAGFIMGTLRYMSPEQVRGRVDQRSDMFSAGAVFYELMAYRAPLALDDPMAILEELHSTAAPSIFRPDPAIPEDLGAVIERALRKNPDERFRTMTEMREALGAVRTRLAAEAAALRRRLEERAAEMRGLHGELVEQLGGAMPPEVLSMPPERAPAAALEAALRDSEEKLARVQQRIMQARALRPEYERAKARMRFGQWDAAAEALEAIVEQMPEHAGARDELARARAEILRAAEELRRAREAAAQAQRHMDDLRRQAGPAAAVEDQEGPWSSAEASRAAGLAALEAQSFATARERFETASGQYRMAAEALDRRVQQLLGDARRRLEQGQFAECLPLAAEVLALFPDHPEASLLHRDAERGVRAEAERRAAFEARCEAARRNLEGGELHAAIEALAALVEEDRDHVRARQLLADARARLAEAEERARLQAEAEEQARRQAEEEERARLQTESEERARLQAEARARRQAEAEARAQQLRAEAEARARRLAEERARQEAEEARVRLAEAEARARRAEEEERARLAEEQARATTALLEQDSSDTSPQDQTVLIPGDDATVLAAPGPGGPRSPHSTSVATEPFVTRDAAEAPAVIVRRSASPAAAPPDTARAEPQRPERARRPLLLAVAGGMALVAIGAWLFFSPPGGVPRDVEQLRQLVTTAHAAAVNARAGELAPDLFVAAEARAREGERLAGARSFAPAAAALRDAAARYEEAGRAARAIGEERARASELARREERAKADEARAAMLAEKARASRAGKESQEGLAREAEGGAQYEKQAFGEAAEHFRAAERLFATVQPPAAAPPPPPPSPPPDDAEIRATLRLYVRAYETKNAALLQQVWPTIPPENLSRTMEIFEQARSIRMTLKVGPIRVNGNDAEAAGPREVVIITRGNETVPPTRETMRFRFKRANNRWVIAAVVR